MNIFTNCPQVGFSWRVKERREWENPPPIAIITTLTLTPKIARIPKARSILSLGDTVRQTSDIKYFVSPYERPSVNRTKLYERYLALARFRKDIPTF
jgi:hypothetical protein